MLNSLKPSWVSLYLGDKRGNRVHVDCECPLFDPPTCLQQILSFLVVVGKKQRPRQIIDLNWSVTTCLAWSKASPLLFAALDTNGHRHDYGISSGLTR